MVQLIIHNHISEMQRESNRKRAKYLLMIIIIFFKLKPSGFGQIDSTQRLISGSYSPPDSIVIDSCSFRINLQHISGYEQYFDEKLINQRHVSKVHNYYRYGLWYYFDWPYVKSMGYYAEGKKDGYWAYYKSGRLYKVKLFRMGRCVKRIKIL